MPFTAPPVSTMHRCLNISELQIHIFEYCAIDSRETVAMLARTCRDFHESALEVLWRELEDISPLVKLLPLHMWHEIHSNGESGQSVTTLDLIKTPTIEQWDKMNTHTKRVQRLTYSHQRCSETGAIYRLSRPLLTAFGRYVRRPPGRPQYPLLPNLRTLHMDFYDHRRLCVAECLPYLGGRALTELHMHCDCDDQGTTDSHNLLDLSTAISLLPAMSPELQILTFRDSRERTRFETCSSLHTILKGYGKSPFFRHLAACSMTMEKRSLPELAAMRNLVYISIAIHTEQLEEILPPIAAPTYIPFQKLETLMLDVSHLEHATACIGALGAQTLRRLRLVVPKWREETSLASCFEQIAKQRHLYELIIRIVGRPAGIVFAAIQGVDACLMNTRTLSTLFALPNIETLSISTNDHARFETDLDDAGIHAMAIAWPRLRSLTIVQGSTAPRGLQLPQARTSMGSLLALRDHCPNLSGLSISLDTTSFDKAILQAAAVSGCGGASLKKLNIGSRSTPVSNHSFAAQVLRGLFPNLRNIHDGESVAWDNQGSDWQEVGAILRRMTQTPRAVIFEETDVESTDSSAEEMVE